MLYNFLSSSNVSLNVRIEESLFRLRHVLVNGTFITEAHVVARVGGAKLKLLRMSYWAREVGTWNTGPRLVNGTCGGGPFVLGTHGRKRCEEVNIQVGYSSGVVETPEWTIVIRNRPVYDRVSGPKTRLDLTLEPRRSFEVPPHGIVGQSFDPIHTAPLNGKLDAYPLSGTFTTLAFAEGAIEGNASMYEMRSCFETNFAASRFAGAHGHRA